MLLVALLIGSAVIHGFYYYQFRKAEKCGQHCSDDKGVIVGTGYIRVYLLMILCWTLLQSFMLMFDMTAAWWLATMLLLSLMLVASLLFVFANMDFTREMMQKECTKKCIGDMEPLTALVYALTFLRIMSYSVVFILMLSLLFAMSKL